MYAEKEYSDFRLKLCVVFKQDTRDGNTNGKLRGRHVFVCKRNCAIFVPIEAAIPEENFDENPVKAETRRKFEKHSTTLSYSRH